MRTADHVPAITNDMRRVIPLSPIRYPVRSAAYPLLPRPDLPAARTNVNPLVHNDEAVRSLVVIRPDRRDCRSPGPPGTHGVAADSSRLDKSICRSDHGRMNELEVIEHPTTAAVALDPFRHRVLAALDTPASAASLAPRLGVSRQQLNYHLRLLEQHGLVEPAGERQWGGITERLVVATARSYVVSPAALGPLGADPDRTGDRLSASYLVALAARIVKEVGTLLRRARDEDKRLATLSLDTVVSFRSPAERAAFTEELTGAITHLVARYHSEGTAGARPHRLVVAAYPAPAADPAPSEQPS